MTEKQNNKAELDTCKITAYILHIAPNRGFSFREEKHHAKTHQPRNPVPARGHPAHPLCSGPVHDHRGAIPPQAGNAGSAWRPWKAGREGEPLDRPMRG